MTDKELELEIDGEVYQLLQDLAAEAGMSMADTLEAVLRSYVRSLEELVYEND